MRAVRHLLAIVTVLATPNACARFQPAVALRPTPYRAASRFALVSDVAYRPELDRGTFRPSDAPEHRHAPEELAAALTLVRQCLATRAPADVRTIRLEPASNAGASTNAAETFTVELAVVSARPGFYRADRISGGTATAAGAGASAVAATASTHVPGQAEAVLFVRAPNGVIVDDNRLFAQRYPNPEEPIEQRANELCAMLLDEANQYFQWRLAGNGR